MSWREPAPTKEGCRGAAFFALPLIKYTLTRNFLTINRDSHVRQFYRDVTTPYHLPGLAKNSPALTQTATPHTTGPLGCNNIFRVICPLAPGKVCGSTVTNSWFIGIKIFNQEGLWNLCRKPAYASQATFLMTPNLNPSGQIFFNLYLTRLAPTQACRWQ